MSCAPSRRAGAIVGQAFPYTPIANPRYFVLEWTFGIQEEEMQKVVDEARGKGAQAVVLLSHNGMGRRPEARVAPSPASTRFSAATRTTACRSRHWSRTAAGARWSQRGQQRQVSSACSTSTSRPARSPIFRYRAGARYSARLLPADPAMDKFIRGMRAPYAAKLDREACGHRGLLYRRGNFNGHVGPADPRRLDGREERTDRVFARVPLGHVAASRPGDPDGGI